MRVVKNAGSKVEESINAEKEDQCIVVEHEVIDEVHDHSFGTSADGIM